MRSINGKWIRLPIFLMNIFYISTLWASTFRTEVEYRIVINEVKEKIQTNFLGIPVKVDYTLNWETQKSSASDWTASIGDDIKNYKLILDKYKDDIPLTSTDTVFATSSLLLKDLPVGYRYSFIIQAFNQIDEIVAESKPVWAVSGRKLSPSNGDQSSWHYWIPFNGRIPLWLFGLERYFDSSTFFGKVAFHGIWNFAIIGVIIWLFFCARHTGLGRIFMFEKGIVLGGGYDNSYRKRISKEFEEMNKENETEDQILQRQMDQYTGIINKWKVIVVHAKWNSKIILKKIAQKPNVLNAIEGASAEYWSGSEGAVQIEELVKHIKQSKFNGKSFTDYPSVRIILAGIKSHEMNGYHWMKVSEEVDRSIENRASLEHEKIRRKSLMDWLWNLGTFSPLLGLFGTATGISAAFGKLQDMPEGTSQSEIIDRLAGGIYEALWTTIEGLLVGIALMLLYFIYQNKLKWIYSKWEEIYIKVSEWF